MALDCNEILSADIQKDCLNKAIGGIEVNVVLIPFESIDKNASSLLVGNKLVIQNLDLKAGKTGYYIEGVKQSMGASFEMVAKDLNFNSYKHTFSGVVLSPSAENKKSLSELASGSRYVAVVEKIWKGEEGDDAFEVLGWDVGLIVQEMTWNTRESDGIIQFTLANTDGYEEPEMTRNLLETDYATTKTAFENKFAVAAA